jgi:putative heme-binding domain-containing protein
MLKLTETGTLDARPAQGEFGLRDARLIAPGESERSLVSYRMASLGGARMPRLGSRVVDQEALDLIDQWITQMPHPKESAASQAERAETAKLLKVLQDDASDEGARAAAIRRLTATTGGALALARAVAHETLPAASRRAVIAATKDHPAIEVRDLFERFVPESERIARLGERINPKDILDLKGDAARGRAIFAAESVVNCKSCHRLDGVGIELGPDLGKIGAKYPRAALLQELLEPSRSVEPKYIVHQLGTKSGLVHSGLLVERNEKEVVLRDAQNQTIRIAVADVELLNPVKQSLMPDLLLRSLTAQQAADLLEYLASLK